jgi:hypothetical protein
MNPEVTRVRLHFQAAYTAPADGAYQAFTILSIMCTKDMVAFILSSITGHTIDYFMHRLSQQSKHSYCSFT